MSKIEWTEKTWNPIVGCSIVSPGCTNCYAMKMAARLEAMGASDKQRWTKPHDPAVRLSHYAGLTKPSKGGPVWTGNLAQAPEHILLEPLRRKKPTMYFVNSMGDLFHEDVPDEWIDRVFAVMALCPQHTFQVLTKRSARMRRYFDDAGEVARQWFVASAAARMVEDGDTTMDVISTGLWPLPNVWLGVSTEDQKRADERIPDLLATPAAVWFVSAEPLLGPIDFQTDLRRYLDMGLASRHSCVGWLIVGGESGSDARPMHPDWARDIRDQCEAAGVPFFFKQWGNNVPAELLADDPRPEPWRLWQNAAAPKWAFAELGVDRKSLPPVTFHNVGKRANGRLLDGREHNDMPRDARVKTSEAA